MTAAGITPIREVDNRQIGQGKLCPSRMITANILEGTSFAIF
jgi:hypothetical protein